MTTQDVTTQNPATQNPTPDVSTKKAAITSHRDIRGWFHWLDEQLFDHFLRSDAVVPDGDVLEIGAYLGRSAAYIGRYIKPGEQFTVIDLFGGSADDSANQAENSASYATLNREAFEANYLALFDELPTVIQDLSSVIVDYLEPDTLRFAHVDGSHLYEHVRVDVQSVISLLKPDGIVAFDDFRASHTPGVSAAVWEAVANFGLKPLALSANKFYGTFGDHAQHSARLMTWLHTQDQMIVETPEIMGWTTARLGVRPAKDKEPAAKQPAVTAAELGKLTKRVTALEKKVAAAERSFSHRVQRKVSRTIAARRRSN